MQLAPDQASQLARVLLRCPELLLEEAEQVGARAAALGQLLATGRVDTPPAAAALPTSMPTSSGQWQEGVEASKSGGRDASALARLATLLATRPHLLLDPPQLVAERLQALQAVLGGGLPLHLVGQLVLQEPRLLDAPLDAMARRFQAVAASFGSFSDDAVDMVLADPSSLLPVPTPAWDSNSAPATGAQPSTDVNGIGPEALALETLGVGPGPQPRIVSDMPAAFLAGDRASGSAPASSAAEQTRSSGARGRPADRAAEVAAAAAMDELMGIGGGRGGGGALTDDLRQLEAAGWALGSPPALRRGETSERAQNAMQEAAAALDDMVAVERAASAKIAPRQARRNQAPTKQPPRADGKG
ncbi:hypothetical protein V8C86DRAFT_2852390 [Haematococcus lacustris]